MLDRIDQMERDLAQLRADAEAEQGKAQAQPEGIVNVDSPEVRKAAQAFAEAIARAQGQTLPLRFAEGSSLPVLALSNETLAGLGEMGEMGGVGIAVVTAPATAKAGAAA